MKAVLVDYRIDDEEKYNLEKLGYEVLIVPPCKDLYDAVCGHPDMLLHIIDEHNIIVHRNINTDFINILKSRSFNVLFSDKELQTNYPYDIGLNAVNFKNLFIHNIRYTDKSLLKQVQNKKLKNVRQGYTKCSTAVVSDDAIITSDKAIAKCVLEEGIDVLIIPSGDILLPGLNYGFIGGCCGLLEKDVLAFYGDLKYYSFQNEVLDFLKKHNVSPVFLRDGKLIDRGSIFVI